MIAKDSDVDTGGEWDLRGSRRTGEKGSPGGDSPPRPVPRSQLTGVVLCGGASSRMGADKARLQLGERTLLERSVAVLSELCSGIYLASGGRPRYEDMGLPCLLDAVEGVGPLAGLAAALEGSPTEWLVLMACDMPRAEPQLFERLLLRASEERADACLFETEGGLEPLCAVYRVSCLPAVRAALERGERRMTSFHGDGLRIAVLSERELPEELRGRELGLNLNSPEDLARLAGSKGPESAGEESRP